MPITLHPRSTSETDAERVAAAAAEIRDPAWMLARQWQTGEFLADDGGTLVRAALAVNSTPVTLPGGRTPTRTLVEAEAPVAPRALDTVTRARLSAELVRQLGEAGMEAERVRALRRTLAAQYPLHPVTAASPAGSHAGRLPDAAALLGL